jgi:hypothetical protein
VTGQLVDSGFDVGPPAPLDLREENGVPVAGLLFTAVKPSAATGDADPDVQNKT